MPDFLERSIEHQRGLGEEATTRLLYAGRRWDLGSVLSAGGAVVFPHATLTVCGHQIAAAVHAALDCGVDTVLAIGVLHALTPELQAARIRVADGGSPADEPTWSIQGPGLPGRDEWKREFSLSHFQYLWNFEVKRRGLTKPPRLIMRYPNLAGGRPDLLPGYGEVEAIARDAAIVATIDPCHHGVGYGDSPEEALSPENGGLAMARQKIMEGMEMLCIGRYAEYNAHCVNTRSDGRDVGQLLAHIMHPDKAEMLDLITDDMTGPYNSPPPTWVAGALIALTR